MAITGKQHGKNFAVWVDGVKVGDATDCTYTISQEIIPTTSKDDANWEDSITGVRSWGVSVDYYYDDENSFSWEEAFDLMLGATEILCEWSSATATDTYYYGQANIESCSLSAPMGAVNGSIAFHGKGAPAKASVPSS